MVKEEKFSWQARWYVIRYIYKRKGAKMKTDKYVGNYVTGENYDQFAKDFVSDVRAMLKKDAPDWKIAKNIRAGSI